MTRPRGPEDPPPAERPTCRTCHRPLPFCVCQLLDDAVAVDNRCEVFILQHPRERLHPKGTAPLVLQGLRRTHLTVAHFDDRGEPHRRLELPPGTGLLYPHPRSRPLETTPPAERPRHLLLLDGTWGNAQRLYRCNPWLTALPHFHLEPETPERYRIRGEQDPHGRSTVEAVVGALRLLEPETVGLERLILAFDRMIDQQVDVIEQEAAGPRRRQRPRPERALHHALRERWEEVRLVYTESVACDDGQRRPLQWAALRPATGAVMERLLRVAPATPNARHLAHMELTAADLAEGVDPDTLRRDWTAFCGPQPVVTAWNQSTLDQVLPVSGDHAYPVLLKAAYCNHRRTRSTTLEAVLAREGLAPRPVEIKGRAARRLGQAWAVLERLVGEAD